MKKDHLCCIFHVQIQSILGKPVNKLQKPETEKVKIYMKEIRYL